MTREARPGAYSGTGRASGDDEITRPDLSDSLVIQMAAMFGNLKAHERVRAIELLANWSKCSADRRACVEFSARELAKVPSEVI